MVSYGERDIERIERRDKGNGKGDIVIGYEERVRRSRNGTHRYTVPVGLFGVENVREVEALMLETFHAADDRDYEKRKRLSALDADRAATRYLDR